MCVFIILSLNDAGILTLPLLLLLSLQSIVTFIIIIIHINDILDVSMATTIIMIIWSLKNLI